MERNKNKRKYLENFNPGVCELSKCKHQDFLLRKFNAGEEFQQFNDFITNEAIEYAQDGNGVTQPLFRMKTESDLMRKKQRNSTENLIFRFVEYLLLS